MRLLFTPSASVIQGDTQWKILCFGCNAGVGDFEKAENTGKTDPGIEELGLTRADDSGTDGSGTVGAGAACGACI